MRGHHDFVTVTSGPGETWVVTAQVGASSNCAGAAIALGTPLVETVVGVSGVYVLNPIFHLPGVGFTMTVDRPASPFPLMTGGTCAACMQIPTLGQWGLILLGLLILTFGVVALRSRQTVLAPSGLAGTSGSSFPVNLRSLPFNGAAYRRMLAFVMLGFVAVFAVAVFAFGYEMNVADVPGSLVAGPLLAYLLHLFGKNEE